MALFERAVVAGLQAEVGQRELDICLVCLGDGEMPFLHADPRQVFAAVLRDCPTCKGRGAWPSYQGPSWGPLHA